MSDQVKILLVDDEEDILEFLGYNLRKDRYNIRVASGGREALSIVQDFIPDVVILDIMMPEMDGIEVCTQMRENAHLKDTLIVFLTARNESFTQISALESGGDDFITKPIKPNVFKSRIRALVRRHYRFQNQKKEEVQNYGDLSINFEQYNVSVKGEKVTLAKKEFELLRLLTSKPGKVFRRGDILNQVWGREVIVGDRTIDVHIRKLREKLGKDYIITIKGVGYKFEN